MSIAVVRDCADIWARLFDHRPFLNGEIKLFLKEFEESRKDREIARLFEVVELVTDVRDNQISEACNSTQKLDKLNVLLDISLQNCNTLLENESRCSVDSTLKENREMRAKQWETFMNDIESKYMKIDNTFKGKEEELRQFYKELEQKLLVN